MNQGKLAHFILLGRSAARAVDQIPETVASDSLLISQNIDLALSMPELVKSSSRAAKVYRYLFVFENFLRELIKETLAESNPTDWWDTKVPRNVLEEVSNYQGTDERKSWMALGVREKIALTTYPQLLTIIEHCWKSDFEQVVKDKSLVQEARHITHMRNAVCHMTDIPDEEVERIRQVLRDWFRVIAP